MRRCLLFAAAACLLLVSSSALANVPPPEDDFPEPEPPVAAHGVRLIIEKGDGPVRIEIPRAAANQLGAIEAPRDDRTRTIIAGGAMATAILLFGMWFVRRRKNASGKVMAGLLIGGALCLVTSGAAIADLGPFPSRPRPRPPLQGNLAEGVVSVNPRGDEIVIHMTNDQLTKLVRAARAQGARNGGVGSGVGGGFGGGAGAAPPESAAPR